MHISAQDTASVIAILDDWGLNNKEIVTLLGISTPSRQINRYREGNAFPENDDLHKRIVHIAGISEALYTAFPKNSQMAKVWLKTPHRRFQKQTPLQTIVQNHLTGLIMVRCELDCAFSWQYAQTKN